MVEAPLVGNSLSFGGCAQSNRNAPKHSYSELLDFSLPQILLQPQGARGI